MDIANFIGVDERYLDTCYAITSSVKVKLEKVQKNFGIMQKEIEF